MQDTEITTMVRVRPETRRLIDLIAESLSWPNVTVLQKAVEALAKQQGLAIPDNNDIRPARRSRSKRPAAA